MKIIIRLKERKLNEEHMLILMNYLNGEITWIEAHNLLIPLGIRLNDDGSLVDY